ncbi:MAG TPA: hypothetical protein VK912_08755 [Longimicrobiales bacterium]|nr:hypothetical protein [Longimicrobiales bacterium]
MNPGRPEFAGPRDRQATAAALRSIVGDVVAEAVRAAGAGGVVVLDDWTPEGELAYEWLVAAIGEARIWRGATVASNVQGVTGADAQVLGSRRFVQEHSGLTAHPCSKTALLLGGRPPQADLFPLGDLYASQVARLAGGWSVPEDLRGLVASAGGIDMLDAALARLIDGREPAEAALDSLAGDVAGEVLRLYERGRYYRLRPRLVPKLGARTLGVDLFD